MEVFDYVVALKIFAAGSLVYGAVLFILIRFQRAFLFQNRLPIFRTLEAKEFASAHFAMTTADGETLDAVWLIACGPPCAALLYLHGNATNLNDRMPRIQALSALGFSVLAIDWRGFGNSTGTPSQAGCQLDAEAALQWLAHRTDLSKTVVLAESLGAGVAVELVAKHMVGALVLQAPFSSAVDVAKAFLPIFPIRKLMIDQFRSDLLIQDVRTSLLIQHGRSDWVVPFRFGIRLYARAPEPKRFIGYVGGGHNDLPEKHDSYRDLKRFVLECFDTSMGTSTAIRASPAAPAPPTAIQPRRLAPR
jgi:fermentation-respiration switch protein FrsA (DUF1100 family)